MEKSDFRKMARRPGIGIDRINNLRRQLKTEKFVNLNTPKKMELYWQNVLGDRGMNLDEILENMDIIIDFIMSDENTTKNFMLNYENIVPIPPKYGKSFLEEIIPRIKEGISGSLDDYNDKKTEFLIRCVITLMRNINISDSEKFEYIEENFDFLAENPLLLSGIYSYFDSDKRYDLYTSRFGRTNKKMEERVEHINKKVMDKTGESIVAKQVLQRKGVRRLGFDIRQRSPEVQEKIKQLYKLGFKNLELIENEKLLLNIPIEYLVRLSLDEYTRTRLNFIADDPKRIMLLKEFFKRPYAKEELLDFINNISIYGDLLKNYPIENMQNSTEIQKILNLIISDEDNALGIDSPDKLDDYTRIRAEKYLSILAGNIEKIDSVEEMKKAETVPKTAQLQKKEALYRLLFGLNTAQVENLVKKYGEDVFKKDIQLDKLDIEDKKIIGIIRTLRKLYEAKDVNKISEQILSDKDFVERLKTEDININYASLETKLIEFYNDRINEALTNPVTGTQSRDINYKGQASSYPVRNFLFRLFRRKDKEYERIEKFNPLIETGLFGRRKRFLLPSDSGAGRNVKVYELDPEKEFMLLARVDGAYIRGKYSEPFDFSTQKFVDKTPHGNCKSMVSNNLLSLARCDEFSGPLVGYYKQDAKELLMMAPWDISSVQANKRYSPQRAKWSLGRGIQFRLPKFLNDFTRHNHNELVYDRLLLNSEKMEFKSDKPQYVIYVKDFDEDTIIDNKRWKEIVKKYGNDFDLKKSTPFSKRLDILNEIAEKTGKKIEELVYDDKYRQSIKAAAQLDIPLLIIDREKIIENEKKKMDQSIEDLKGEQDVEKIAELIPSMITNYYNNNNSVRFASRKIKDKFFNKEQRIELIEVIKNKIAEFESKDPKEAKKLRDIYEQAIILENNKLRSNTGRMLRTDNGDEDKDTFLVDEMAEINNRKSEEFSRFEVPRLIQEISKTTYYDENKTHSIEHIQKVMTIADKIASAKNFDRNLKEILIISAAFHDSGRGKDKDGNDAHGIASAMTVQKYYEENPDNPFNINESNLPIIQTIIEYHEINDKDKSKAHAKLRKIGLKYGLDVKGNKFNELVLLADALKDADALDRYRFHTRAKLNPEYLRFEESKGLMPFAENINKKFALKVLQDIYHATPEALKGHSKIGSLEYFRKQTAISNPDYIEPHIDVDELLELYRYEVPQPKSEKEQNLTEDDKIVFKRDSRDFCLYDDLTPQDVKEFVLQLTRTSQQFRENNIDRDGN